MNNLKKTAFGLLLGGIVFGGSAFTTIKRSTIIIYYKTDMSHPDASDPRGYQYYSGDRCETNGNLCSAQWDIGTHTPPTIDGEALPTIGVTFQTGSQTSGHFE